MENNLRALSVEDLKMMIVDRDIFIEQLNRRIRELEAQLGSIANDASHIQLAERLA